MPGADRQHGPGNRTRLPGAWTTSRTGACSSSAVSTQPCRSQRTTSGPYLYGLLHAPDYRERYRADLSKDLPRIPFAPDFGAFRDAGAALAQLHLRYETCPEYELQVDLSSVGPGAYQLSDKKMSWGGTNKEPDRSVLHVTPAVTLRGIPEAAHNYVVNGRTPLEWAVDRLHIRHDKESGIINDPNAWFRGPPGGSGLAPAAAGACKRGDDTDCGGTASRTRDWTVRHRAYRGGLAVCPSPVPARPHHTLSVSPLGNCEIDSRSQRGSRLCAGFRGRMAVPAGIVAVATPAVCEGSP